MRIMQFINLKLNEKVIKKHLKIIIIKIFFKQFISSLLNAQKVILKNLNVYNTSRQDAMLVYLGIAKFFFFSNLFDLLIINLC